MAEARRRCPRSLDPGLAEALAAGRDRARSTPTSSRRCEAAARLERDRHQRHRLGQVAVASTCRCSTASPRDPKRRALYLYPTKALAQDQARKLAELAPAGPAPGDLRRRHARARSGRAIRRRSNLVLTNPDMLHVGILPHHKQLGRLPRQPRLGRRRRGAHLPRRLRLARRQRAAPAAPGGARSTAPSRASCCASATIANPVELAERLVGDAVRAGRRRRRAAGRAARSRCGTRR